MADWSAFKAKISKVESWYVSGICSANQSTLTTDQKIHFLFKSSKGFLSSILWRQTISCIETSLIDRSNYPWGPRSRADLYACLIQAWKQILTVHGPKPAVPSIVTMNQLAVPTNNGNKTLDCHSTPGEPVWEHCGLLFTDIVTPKQRRSFSSNPKTHTRGTCCALILQFWVTPSSSIRLYTNGCSCFWHFVPCRWWRVLFDLGLIVEKLHVKRWNWELLHLDSPILGNALLVEKDRSEWKKRS